MPDALLRAAFEAVEAVRTERSCGRFDCDRVAGDRVDHAQQLVRVVEVPAGVAERIVELHDQALVDDLGDAEQHVGNRLAVIAELVGAVRTEIVAIVVMVVAALVVVIVAVVALVDDAEQFSKRTRPSLSP